MKGRMGAAKGPTVSSLARVVPSATTIIGECRGGEVHVLSVEPEDGVVCAGVGGDAGDLVAGFGVDDVPVFAFEGGFENGLAVGGDGHAITPVVVILLPEDGVALKVDAGEGFGLT